MAAIVAKRLVEHLERSSFVVMKETAQSEAERRLVARPTGDDAALVTLREALGASTRCGVKRLRACRSAERRPDGRASTPRHPHFVEYPISSTRHRLAKIPFQCVRAVATRFVRVPIRNFNFQRTVSDEFVALAFLELDIMPAKMSSSASRPPRREGHIYRLASTIAKSMTRKSTIITRITVCELFRGGRCFGVKSQLFTQPSLSSASLPPRRRSRR
jgi:hypothetical protein